MIKIEDFVKLDEDGKMVIDSKGFKSAFDSEINKALDTRINTERDKIRAEIEQEAKLTADEKLKAEMAKLETKKKETLIEINRIKAKAKMETHYTDKEIERFLKLVTEDEATLTEIDDMIADKVKYDEAQKKKFEEEYLTKQPKIEPKGKDDTKPPKPKGKTIDEIKNYYS